MSALSLSSTTRINAALALVRVVVGSIFVAHGAQKIFQWGLAGVAGSFGQMGIPFAEVMGPAVAILEFFGGIVLVFGGLTRWIALGLAGTMVGAIAFVHLPNGFFNPGGVEFPLALLAMTLALVITGGGAWSLDGVVARRRAAPEPAPAPALQKRAA